MKLQGILPLHQTLDKEISEAYKEEILATNMSYQLVLPDVHRRNIAEREIQTWKSHFIGILSGTAATFPLHLWCQIITQAKRQLLLVSQTNLNTNISSYAYMYGQHDNNAAPFVTIRMESLVHKKPNSKKDVCRTLHKRLRPQNFFPTLLCVDFLDVKYPFQQSISNSIPQAQIHFKPKRHPRRQRYCCSGQSGLVTESCNTGMLTTVSAGVPNAPK